jgi:hypothetical protein
MADRCSAKEVVIAAQEIIERLSGEESDGESEVVSLAVQLIRLQSLLTKCKYVRLQLPCWRALLLSFHI